MRLHSFRLALIQVCLLGTVSPSLASTPSATGVLVDRIVAQVDGGIVLQSELDDQVRIISKRLRDQGTRMPPDAVLRQQVLENLILYRIQLQRAERLGVRISDEQLNMALARIAERNGVNLADLPKALAADGIDYGQFREQMRREMTVDAVQQRDVMARIAVSEREIERWLQQYEANRGNEIDYDISQILIPLPSDATQVQVQEAEKRAHDIHARLVGGADFAALAVAESAGQAALTGGHLGWRRGSQLPQQLAPIIQALSAGEISGPVRTSSGFHIFLVNDTRGGDDTVVQLQTKARHILMKTNEVRDEATVRSLLEDVRERVLAGESFADIAMIESEDASSATRGGDLGWNPDGTFVPEFEAALAKLEPGELSQPFRSPFGWHVILLEDRQERDTTEEIRRSLAIQEIRASKLEQETELWLRRIRDEAWVEILGS